MKRSIGVALLSLLLALGSYGETGIHPPTGPDVIPAIPAACNTPSTWAAAAACLDAIVLANPTVFPGAVIGRQADNGSQQVYAKGAGFAHNSVVSLASVTKPMVKVGMVKLVQDHYASPACTPMTANCVFPQKFETTLLTALTRLDALRGTDVVSRWFNRTAFDDATLQRSWKNQIKIKHLLQMTSGLPPMSFTGYVFCPGGVCPEIMEHDVTCNPDQPGACRQAYLFNQYLARRGPAIPNGCRPRPASGPRLFNFDTYYNGNPEAPYKLMREFERRWSYQPGLTAECVLVENSLGSAWVDSRTVRETEIAKFFLGMPLLHAPGTEYHYTQQPLYIEALLIESLSGQRLDDYLDTKLFTPLGMADTSFKVHPGTTQYQRLVDIKRILTSRARTLPDFASPLQLDTVFGDDKNIDEPRDGWDNDWPEGGAYSTASDLLRFLNFIRTGKAPNGAVILNAESLALVTTPTDPVSPRTYAFATSGPGVIGGNGYFGTMMRRNTNTCTNITVLPQIVVENPDFDVQQYDYQYRDVMHLRGAVVRMLEGIPGACTQ
ncbi:MAG TPA: serine hydrolase domain-containing protein [Thermoanaerobaculia bacterium]|jgi:CubicO group peptidase (beta-lactamase class C family)